MHEIRVGLIGYGNWVRTAYVPHLETLDGVRVVAVSARSEASRSAAAEALGGDLTLYADWRALLADSSVDAVMVALPAALHAEVTTAAARSGKHLFFEPPAGCRREEVAGTLAALDASESVIQCDLELRCVPVVQAARRILDEGDCGEVLMAKVVHLCDWARSYGAEAGDEGVFLWLGCWYLDLLDVVFAAAPTGVQVAGGYHVAPHLFDHGYALLRYPSGLGVYELNMVAAAGTVIELHVTATGGEIVADVVTGNLRQRRTGEETWQSSHHPPAEPVHGFVGMRESMFDFFNAIRERGTPHADPEASRRVHEAALLCTEVAPRT